MRPTHVRRAILLALLAVTAEGAAAQDSTKARRRGPGSLVRPVLEGALGGAVLATAYVSGGGSGWLMRDESAVRAALASGVAGALAAYGVSTRLPAGAADRPRLRVALGAGTEEEGDVTLALRAPVYRRLALEGAVLVRNSSSQRVEQQTRCSSILGCTTGSYVVGERREQSVAALLRAALSVPTGTTITPVLFAGAGPMASRLDASNDGAGGSSRRRDDLIAAGGIGFELGRVSRWTVEAEARGPVPTWNGDRRVPEFSVRVGRAFGYR